MTFWLADLTPVPGRGPRRQLHWSTTTRADWNQWTWNKRTWRNILHWISWRNQELQNLLSNKCNQKVEDLSTDSKNGFPFKVKPILELSLLSDIKKYEDFSREFTFDIFLNQTKRNIYLQTCKFNEKFEKSLKKAYLFNENAIVSSFIKSRN